MYVLGTAGHVDHGKSTLVHALTGIDPDRLAEEKARGLTIDLGFAWLTLPDGREVGIVDVPGHERFVHNMLAGAGSIDAVLFIIAANEGWMPQSEEHLAIIDLLGARGGLVVLTKIDTVETPPDVAEHLRGTVLENAPIVRLSAKTGEGMQDLRDAIANLLNATPTSRDLHRPRLFVDRSFTIKGAGTVVTGTLTGGTLHDGDEIEVAPAGTRARIRGIQTHHRSRDHAEPGSRVALNLAGLERHEIVRGDAVVKPGQWRATASLGVRITAVRSIAHPLTAKGSFKLYLGAAEVDARLMLLDAERLRAGETALARITLTDPVVATEFDRFVLRDTGRRETVAGGVILDAHPLRASRDESIARLSARETAAGEQGFIDAILAERGVIPTADSPWLTGSSLPPTLRTYTSHPAWLTHASDAIRYTLTVFHEREPLAKGMPKEDLRKLIGLEDARLFAEIIEHDPRFTTDNTLVRLSDHEVTMTPDQQNERDAVVEAARGFTPPNIDELIAKHGRPLVAALLDAGDLVKIDVFGFTRDSIMAAKETITEAVTTEGPITTSRVRELLGTSRKYAIPLLEHLDATGFTKRDGDTRTIR